MDSYVLSIVVRHPDLERMKNRMFRHIQQNKYHQIRRNGENFNRPREIWLRISQGKQEYIDIFRGLKSEPDTEIGQKGHFWMDTV
jgi:hypothetical protein